MSATEPLVKEDIKMAIHAASPAPTDAETDQYTVHHANLGFNDKLSVIRNKKAFIIDMDGVLYQGNKILPGVQQFIQWMKENQKKFLFLTNNSAPTPRELQQKLHRLGIEVDESHFYTSAICTAKFLSTQKPGGSCYVIGEPGLHYALYSHGFTMNDVNPDFVVVGEGNTFNYEKIAKAVTLVSRGAKLIGTNPDVAGIAETSIIPSCGAFVACIELASGKKGFFCGKPTSLMMRYGQRILGCQRTEVCMIGDRMDTDILGAIYAELDSVLVLTGVTKVDDLPSFPYSPYLVLSGVKDIPPGQSEPVDILAQHFEKSISA